MAFRSKLLVFCIVCMAWLIFAGSSQAQMRGGLGGFGGLGYGGYGGLWTGIPYGFAQNQDQLPYYALYPPVYYSRPVPRTYGYSPFAYPPGFTTPELAPEPVEIINPHVPESLPAPADVKPTSDRTATLRPSPVPKVVLNPYVDQAQLSFDP